MHQEKDLINDDPAASNNLYLKTCVHRMFITFLLQIRQ